jgi:hypothetical protein
MKRPSKVAISLLFGLLLAGLGVAHAKPESEAVPPRIAAARATVDSMRAQLITVLKLLEAARVERDMVKLNTIGDKLTALKGLLRVAEQAELNLEEAILKHDDAAAAREEDKLKIASGKVIILVEQAATAVGEISVYSGETVVDVVQTERAPTTTGEVIRTFVPTITISERPPAASPYQ